ncbi:MAG: FAD-binding oxidoreductase [Acidobacteriaceae bacterium]|nr:FAD-binding oxidoreductase [Acidobacteriaceae bacterium]
MVVAEQLREALAEWQALLGPGHVVYEGDLLREFETATFSTSQSVPAVLRPGSREEIQECLRIANRLAVPLYIVSGGKNWGYGSRVPVRSGCAVLDLGRMNRILDFSEELAYVTVEPGVTQRQLYAFLKQHNSKLWMDASGASPDSSLIGNTVERGFGHTPYGDHFAYAAGLEVVLPTGEVIETGAAQFADCVTAPVNRWGVGPSLDGLFSQSNFGVVTRMSIHLMPEPERFEAFFYTCEAPNALPAIVDALRPLKLQELLRSAMHIANDYKVLGGLRQYPWEEAGGKTPLTPEVMSLFRRSMSFGYWNASGGIYGTPAQVSEAKRLLRKRLAHLPGKLHFVTPRLLRTAKRFAGPFKLVSGWDIRRTVELVEPVVDLMRGIPTDHALGSCYWRKRTPIPARPDPDRDGCGLLWYSPTAPAEGEKTEQLSRIAIETMLEYGFEPMISLTMLTPRIIQCVTSLTYDRDVSGEDERALDCYHELGHRCTAAGFWPYRLGIASMDGPLPNGGTGDFLGRLKALADPNGILAPGRYGIG